MANVVLYLSFSLTVIKSGPGYHEEKTYNFGPRGVTRTETTRTSGGGREQKEETEERLLGPDMSTSLIKM